MSVIKQTQIYKVLSARLAFILIYRFISDRQRKREKRAGS
ncbi:hypothetical protein AOT82_1703 [Psychrobacter sp. AntiMn-1]|nr:hypothetical protein AOT82_1703 [Psychrobacter sp. AntiMn-1]